MYDHLFTPALLLFGLATGAFLGLPRVAVAGAGKAIRDAGGLTPLDYARKLKADDATLRILQ
jgi:hypothetical protein